MTTWNQLLQDASAALRMHDARRLSAGEALALAAELAGYGAFDLAAQVVEVTRPEVEASSPAWIKLGQKLAFYTARDTRQPVLERLDAAVEILTGCGLETAAAEQETLGLAGSMRKRRWEYTGQLADLEKSAAYYTRGCQQGIGEDGYLAINAAFVLDLLASELARQQLRGDPPALRKQALALRRNLVAEITTQITAEMTGRLSPDGPIAPEKWWSVAVLIEAHVGLDDLDGARAWLAAAARMKPHAWQRESTLRQIVRLNRARDLDEASQDACLAVLAEYFPREIAALRTSPPGRVGLALSGGGFRASLFHLGTLARLAEADFLRHIEVISCVSGGSIVGAHYFLLLRNLLQQKLDEQITRDDYIALLRELIARFTAGTQANLRMEAMVSFRANLRIVFDPTYTRSDRVAELYDRHFYNGAGGAPGGTGGPPVSSASATEKDHGRAAHATDGASTGRTLLREMSILPKGCGDEFFNPGRDNWGRRNKVPALVLNCTALNTGHAWQFTTAGMGETRMSGLRIDSAWRLRWMHHWQAPAAQCDFPLSRAVAASSCVPGMFPPVRLVSLYPGKVVALVDGAIYDNQGVSSLLSEDCSVLIVSDAAKPVGAQDAVASGPLSVMGRTMGLLQVRVREAQFRELAAMRDAGLLQMWFMHLKHNVRPELVGWEGCDQRPPASPHAPSSPSAVKHVPQHVQELLAAMRTDLDAFSDMETWALMCHGYRVADDHLASTPWAAKEAQSHERLQWPFDDIAKMVDGDDAAGHERLLAHLRAGAQRGGKWLRLSRIVRRVALGAGAFIVAAVCFFAMTNRHHLIIRGVYLIGFLVAIYLLVLGAATVWRFRPHRRRLPMAVPTIGQLAIDVLILLVGWIPALIDVTFVRPAYLRLGRIENSFPRNPQKK